MRVLVVKTTSMGDVVHALPAVSDMARCVPGIEIDWLVESPFAVIPTMSSVVAQVHPLSWRKWRKALLRRETWVAMASLRARLKARRYDLVIDFQGLLKSAVWASQAGAPVCGYDHKSIREPLAAIFYQSRAGVGLNLHAVDRCRRLAALHFGYPLPESAPDFDLISPAANWQPPSRYAVLIPCASRPEKLWPVARWRDLVARCEGVGLCPVVMWGSPAEQARAREIAAASSAMIPPFLSVGDSASVLAGAELVVGLDTGFTHLAAAFKRPTVGIYCDHEPGLAGVTGAGFVRSLGGKGQVPDLRDVQKAFDAALEHCRD